MIDYRSEAEKFVTEFLDYVQQHDIRDYFNNKTQKMERSSGVQALVDKASRVFPSRADDGKKETDKLNEETVDQLVEGSPNVIDTREQFARRIVRNGGVRKLLREVLTGDEEAIKRAEEFFAAEDGEKEFYVPPKD